MTTLVQILKFCITVRR